MSNKELANVTLLKTQPLAFLHVSLNDKPDLDLLAQVHKNYFCWTWGLNPPKTRSKTIKPQPSWMDLAMDTNQPPQRMWPPPLLNTSNVYGLQSFAAASVVTVFNAMHIVKVR